MAKISRLSGEQRENLVAYLDGELDEAAAKEIEQALASSPVARHDVDMLSRTWDLLGQLPTSPAGEDFTSRTISSIRAAEKPKARVDDAAVSRAIRRTLGLAIALLVLLGAGTAGFLATNRWVPNEADEILNDYEVISELDKYLEAGDIDYLTKLQEHREFTEHDEPNTP
ncbi:MAG: hypothetical protein NT069_07050 [Planctomycetota bacterium]|nr:hypothetical protein [Planctomycetota bacterium]